jgi:RimJ/RimL family protein N-acetyltransferase
MRHDLTLDGHAFRLRPITDADAGFVLGLRQDAGLNRYLHPTSPILTDQLTWLREYYDRPRDYYFVIERRVTGSSEGVIALYDIDISGKAGEWGRWILRRGSLAAVESAFLIYVCGLERLALSSMFCRTVAANHATISFHDSCGVPRTGVLRRHFQFDGQSVDAVEHRMTREVWTETRPVLERMAYRTSRKLRNG